MPWCSIPYTLSEYLLYIHYRRDLEKAGSRVCGLLTCRHHLPLFTIPPFPTLHCKASNTIGLHQFLFIEIQLKCLLNAMRPRAQPYIFQCKLREGGRDVLCLMISCHNNQSNLCAHFLSSLFEVSRLVGWLCWSGRQVGGGCKRNAALSNVDPSSELQCTLPCKPLSLVRKTQENAKEDQPRYHFFGRCIALFVFFKKVPGHSSSF